MTGGEGSPDRAGKGHYCGLLHCPADQGHGTGLKAMPGVGQTGLGWDSMAWGGADWPCSARQRRKQSLRFPVSASVGADAMKEEEWVSG